MRSVAIAILAGLAVGCEKRSTPAPQQAPVASTRQDPAPSSGPVLPARHQSSEVKQPGQSYQADGFPTVSQLGEGQSGWIRPWTMWNTIEGNFYINTAHSYRTNRTQPDWIKITRRGGGFIVDLAQTPFEWSAIDMKYPKQGDGSNMPVVEFRE